MPGDKSMPGDKPMPNDKTNTHRSRSKFMLVFKWEFLKFIKSKQFLVMTILTPLMIGFFGFLPHLFESFSENTQQTIAVVDETGRFYQALDETLPDNRWALALSQGALEQLKSAVQDNVYDSLLVIPADVLETGRVQYYSDNPVGAETTPLQASLSAIVARQRLAQEGLDPAHIQSLSRPVAIDSVLVGNEDQGRRGVAVPIGLAVLLMLGAMFSGSMVMYAVIKEKTSRVVELLLSSVSAQDLMIGKVLGFGLSGLIQIAIWTTVGLAMAQFYLNVTLEALSPVQILSYPFFFLLGYLSIAATYSILAAGMKDLQSGSQLQGLVTLFPVVPLIMTAAILATPDALWIRVMGYIPPFTPGVMMLRLSVTSVPWWEIAATVALLAVYVYLLLRFAAKVFEVGLLMYGKSASVKELWRWGMQPRRAAGD